VAGPGGGAARRSATPDPKGRVPCGSRAVAAGAIGSARRAGGRWWDAASAAGRGATSPPSRSRSSARARVIAGRVSARGSSPGSRDRCRPRTSPRCQQPLTAAATASKSTPSAAQLSVGQARSSSIRSAGKTSSPACRSGWPVASS
jgi:hypothetical protein